MRAVVPIAIAVIAGVVATGGSAAPLQPYRATFGAGPLLNGATRHVNLTITNLASQRLGSANVTAATLGTSSFQILAASASQGTVDLSGAPSLLALRDLNLASGANMAVDVTVKTPCPVGTYTWGITAKQRGDYSGADFTLTNDSSLTTSVSAGGCRLVWDTQPTHAVVNTTITGGLYDPSGSPVKVHAVDGDDQLLSSWSGMVKLNPSGGAFTSSPGGFTADEVSLVGGYATFSNFSSTATGKDLTVTASTPGLASSPASGQFDVSLVATLCTTAPCPVPTTQLDSNTKVNASFSGSSTFVALNYAAIPPSVTAPGGGCAYFHSTNASGFEETDGRSSTGELLFTYFVNKKLIEKRYGKTQGQQFIPLCAGGAKKDAQGNLVPCLGQGVPYGPWKGKELDQNGRFDGLTADAVCDPTTGLYWGIIGSFQDYTNSNPALRIDPNLNPTITSWDSNTTDRFFNGRVPAGWDWKFGG